MMEGVTTWISNTFQMVRKAKLVQIANILKETSICKVWENVLGRTL
jgi:hypothetical protein